MSARIPILLLPFFFPLMTPTTPVPPIPELTWSHQISLHENSIYCVACSDNYDENEYIRDWDEFHFIIGNKK